MLVIILGAKMKNTSKHIAGKIGVGIIGASPDRGWALTAPTGHAQLTQLSLFGGRGDDRTLQPLTVSDSYRHVPGDLPVPAAEGEPKYDDLEKRLAEGPVVGLMNLLQGEIP
jgi:hypothetical protein